MTSALQLAYASETHRADLTAYCRRMLGSACEAEDAVQETLLRAWRASDRFQGRASLRTWLYRIAANVCYDTLDQHSRRPVSVEEVPEPASGPELDPARRAVAREELRLALTAVVGTLPPRQRAVLLLRDVLSWRAAEVAELLDTTVVAVNSALQRARATVDGVDPGCLPAITDDCGRELLARYAAAFDAEDVDALVRSLAHGATGRPG